MEGHELDESGSRQVAGSHEHCNEPLGSIKNVEQFVTS